MKSTNGNRSVHVTAKPTSGNWRDRPVYGPDVKRPKKLRAKATNRPTEARHNRHTSRGRRICDLYDAFMEAMDYPTDTLRQADALRAAELLVAAETARAALLSGVILDPEHAVKLENAARRAERKLNIKPLVEKRETLAERLGRKRADREAHT